ncbi:MAG: hypothetical protein R3D84_09685 [Paracoccaceae bacterium]
MPTIFMNFMGIDELKLTSAGAATERITNVEISLVLDISGSMNSYNRLTNLKAAATEFVDTVLGGAEQDRITISIIPYSGQVNLGKPLLDQFTVGQNHAYSYCMELVDSDFSSISLSTTSTRKHSAHFDPFDYANSSSDTGPNLMFCPYQSANTVMPFSDDADALKTKINGLIAGGNTSIDIGMKWGSLLLDTNAGDVVDGLIAQNVVKTAYSNRPLDPDNVDVLKVLVLMTDGENTTQYQIDDNYLTGTSNIWRRNSDGRLSVYHSSHYGSSDYYSPRDNAWYSSPVGGTSGATQLDWADVWNYASVDYVAYYLNSKPMSQSFSGWWNTFIDSNYSNKNSRLDSVCDAAKAEEIVVYGIALEAPYNGQQVIKSCASSPGHYFDVDGLEISTAFRAIASQISQLRLTQ